MKEFFSALTAWQTVGVSIGIVLIGLIMLVLLVKRPLQVIGLVILGGILWGIVHFVKKVIMLRSEFFSTGHVMLALLFALTMFGIMTTVIILTFGSTATSSSPTPPRPRRSWAWLRRLIGVILAVISIIVIAVLTKDCRGAVRPTARIVTPTTQWVMEWHKAPDVAGINSDERDGGPFPVIFSERTSQKIVFFLYTKSNQKIGEYTLVQSHDPSWKWTGGYKEWKNNIVGELRFKELPDGSLVGDQTTGIDSKWVYTIIRKL